MGKCNATATPDLHTHTHTHTDTHTHREQTAPPQSTPTPTCSSAKLRWNFSGLCTICSRSRSFSCVALISSNFSACTASESCATELLSALTSALAAANCLLSCWFWLRRSSASDWMRLASCWWGFKRCVWVGGVALEVERKESRYACQGCVRLSSRCCRVEVAERAHRHSKKGL